MEYIKDDDVIFINKDIGQPITQSSFLVRIIQLDDGKWVTAREKDLIVFSRYLDGYMMSGYLREFKHYKVKIKKFKGLE